MKSPLVSRKKHDAKVAELTAQATHLITEVQKAQAESAEWRVQYRKIRDRIVGIATHPGATPQIRATLAEFASFRP